MSALDAWREKLQEISRDAFATVEGNLDVKDRELVDDFIENFEFEVALHWMCSVVKRKVGTLTGEQRLRLELLANTMNVPLPF